MDPESEGKGLLSRAGDDLRLRRGLHVVKGSAPKVEFDRGTAWLLAAGNEEQPLLDYTAWRLEKPQLIRTVIAKLDYESNPFPLRVVVLRGGHVAGESQDIRVGRVLTEVFEASRGRASFRVLGTNPAPGLPEVVAFPLAAKVFAESMASTYGAVSTKWPTIPSGQGGVEEREISIETLRSLEENFDLVHSRILEEERLRGDSESGAFWRGSPPTWSDLELSLDIEREVQAELLRRLTDRLENRARGTVILHHQPGSGGSTAALRAAWALHRLYPTAVLRRFSSALPSRLHTLFLLAQRPILLVAEASILPDNAREELYRALAQQGTRVVVLYVERVLDVRNDATGVHLLDPLSPQEAEGFLRAFSRLTSDPQREEELARITRIDDLHPYRTPFFYGLITYEHEFTKVDRYVEAHLAEMPVNSPRVIRRVLEYLALVTIYSDSGLPLGLLPRLLGVSEEAGLSTDDLVGPGPARLLVAFRSKVRILHQVLAEEVLDYFGGGEPGSWRRDLMVLATDLIRDVTEALDPDSVILRDLFRQLFVNRLDAGTDEVSETPAFAPLIEELDAIEPSLGHRVLETLTRYVPNEAHFWNHLGRHQVYRLQRDTDVAEKYLLRAIQLSDDYVHYHTLGVVLRARVRDIARSLRNRPPEEILEAIKPDFLQASDAFRASSDRNPENIYAYVTHVQLIIEVARQLIKSSGARSAANLGEAAAGVRVWMAEQIPLAETLLDAAQRLYGTLYTPDRYITECYAGLRRVYGDLDEVVQLWELALARGLNSTSARRALARAYLARRDRKWRGLNSAELMRIRDLMGINLRTHPRREVDLELWFHSARLLPNFDIDEALAIFYTGSVSRNAYRSAYYSYVLRFILWFLGRTENLDEMFEAIEMSNASFVGRRGVSLEWLAVEPAACPLVSDSELGSWNRERNFWENDSQLRRVNGVIDESTDRVQSGYIRIGGRVKAFFVPTAGGFSPEDKNREVNFLLGFSPEGLRAWEVRPGHVDGGDRLHVGESAVELSFGSEFVPSETEVREVASEVDRERVRSFVGEVVTAFSQLGAEVEVEALDVRVQAALGWGETRVSEALGGELLSYLAGDSSFVIVDREGVKHVRARGVSGKLVEGEPRMKGVIDRFQPTLHLGELLSENGQRFLIDSESVGKGVDRRRLRANQPVEFSPSGRVARALELLPIPSREELVRLVKDQIWKIMQARSGRRKRASLAALERVIRRSAPYEGRFSDAIGEPFKNLLASIADIELLEVEGKAYVQFRGPVAFGRLQPKGERRGGAVSVRPEEEVKAIKVMLGEIRKVVKTRGPLSLQRLGVELHTRSGASNETFRNLGFKSFGDFVRRSDAFVISEDNIVSTFGSWGVDTTEEPRVQGKGQYAFAELGTGDVALAILRAAAIEYVWQAGTNGVEIGWLVGNLARLKVAHTRSFRAFLNELGFPSFAAFLRGVPGLVVSRGNVVLRPPAFFDDHRMREQAELLATVLGALIRERAARPRRLRAQTALRALRQALGVERITLERFGQHYHDEPLRALIEHVEGLTWVVVDGKAWVQLL